MEIVQVNLIYLAKEDLFIHLTWNGKTNEEFEKEEKIFGFTNLLGVITYSDNKNINQEIN